MTNPVQATDALGTAAQSGSTPELVGCTHADEVLTADGHGSFCRSCGETLS